MNIFPKPLEYERNSGFFRFSEKVYLIVGHEIKNKEFERLCSVLWLNFTAGKSVLEIVKLNTEVKSAVISLDLSVMPMFSATNYEYEISAAENRIDISYSEEIGLIHAFSSILQLIGAYCRKTDDFSIECFMAKDSPSLKMRGVHLCVFPETSLLYLKKLIMLCGLYKVSHIVIEFWGMFKFDCLKELSWPNSYSKSDLAPLIADGKALGIEFIPMFNHLGHATQSRFKAGKHVVLDQNPLYEELFVPGGWTWNIKNPDTLSLLSEIRKELAYAFGKGDYFHIGCDEAYIFDGRADGYDKEDNENFVNFLNYTAAEVEAMDRKPIVWGDMFLDKTRFKHPYVSNSSTRCYEYDRNFSSLAKNMIIDDWQYTVSGDAEDTVKYILEKREPENVILTPWDGFPNIRGRCAIAKKYELLGVIDSTWNTVYNDLKFMIYAACQMWQEDMDYTDICNWEVIKCFAAQNLRKLLPCGGDYEKAGFLRTELYSLTN